MKSMCRALFAVLLVTFALSATAASSASAFGWSVEGHPLGTGVQEALNEATTVKKPIVLGSPFATIECSKVAFVGGVIEGPVTSRSNSVRFSECTTRVAGCKVHSPGSPSGVLTTKELVSTVKVGPPTKLRFNPSGKLFMEYKLEGACGVVSGLYDVKGYTEAELVNAATCEKEKILRFNEKPSNLTSAGTGFSEVTGEVGMTLKSGKCWDAQ